MINNNSNGDYYESCSSDIKTLNKSSTNNNIPTNWKKIGEVYSNKLEQPVFICSICLEKADNINSAYTISDGSAFWWHIQHQHSSVEYETIDKISEEIRNFTSNEVEAKALNGESDCKIAEPTDLNVDKIKENQIKLLEEFHENFTKNNIVQESNHSDVKHKLYIEKKTEQNPEIEELRNRSDNNIKVEEVGKTSNCNYYYDNEIHTISDDDEDDDDENEEDENCDLEVTDNYLKHNDMIEISDDEDDQDNVETCPNFSPLPNEQTRVNEVVNTVQNNISDSMETNECDQFKHMRSGRVLSRPMACPLHSINDIPTPDISPCESLANQHLNFTQHNKVHSSSSQEFANSQFLHQVERSFQNQQWKLLQSGENQYSQSRPFKCKSCKMRTKTIKNMNRHQILYHSPDSHLFTTQCEICRRSVLTTKLKRHILHHSSSGHKCDYCGAIYKQKYCLNRHISKIHADRNLNSVSEYQRQLHANYNITSPSIIVQNDNHHMEQSSLMSYAVNSIPTSLTPEEEQQLRYQEW